MPRHCDRASALRLVEVAFGLTHAVQQQCGRAGDRPVARVRERPGAAGIHPVLYQTPGRWQAMSARAPRVTPARVLRWPAQPTLLPKQLAWSNVRTRCGRCGREAELISRWGKEMVARGRRRY